MDFNSDVKSRTCCVLLALNGIIMVSAIVLIFSSTDIPMAKPCDLKKALDSIGLEFTSPCTYNDINSSSLCSWGIAMLVVKFTFFIMLLFLNLMPEKMTPVFYCVLACVAVVFSIVMIRSYNDVLKTKAAKTDTDFVQLKEKMVISLETNYISDNISSSDSISNNWNKFFIKYDCCAIKQVQGTTNDFDNTPWCTTSGSCQATSSQIPKTCCNHVTEDDYENAPSACHSSVTPGTFRSGCLSAIKLLSVTNIEEYKISMLHFSLLNIGILEIAEAIIMVVLTLECVYHLFHNKIRPGDEENENKNQGNE